MVIIPIRRLRDSPKALFWAQMASREFLELREHFRCVSMSISMTVLTSSVS
jgi:hypothetical protein